MSDSPMYDTMAEAKRPVGINSPAARSGGAPISVALDQLRAEIESMRDEVYQIVEKVQPVMGPDMTAENPNKRGDVAEMPVSSVTDILNSQAADLNSLVRTLRSARVRIEL